MQFFPPVHSAMVPEVRAKSLFAGPEVMNGDAFEGLLSAHVASRESGHNAPQTASNGAGATVVVQETSVPSNGSGPDNGVAVRADDDDHVRDARREHARSDAEDVRSGPAKHAGDEESPTGLIRTSGTHDIDTSVAEQGGGIAAELEELTVAAQALIHESKSAKTQEGKATGTFEHLGSRLQAIRDLLTLFRQSEPSARSELAATLGSHIRELRAALPEVMPSRKARGADSVNGQAHPSSSKSDQNPARDVAGTPVSRIVSLVRRMEELGIRLPQAGAVSGQGDAGIPVQARDSVSSGKDASRSDAGRLRVGVKAPGVDSAALASPAGPAQGVRDAARQSRARDAVVTEGQVALQGPGQEQHEPTATKATSQTMRSRVASSAGPDIPAAEVRPLLRQSAGPTLLGGAEAEQMAGGQTVSQDSRPVGAIAGGIRQQSRADFFAAPERDRSGSPRTVAAGTAKADLEGVAGTQPATSSVPAPLVSRLDGPVNARSEQVFRQVETGAFRNLGQGVRQLVIRLEPADLGQVSVILQVRGKEVQAVLRASSQDTSQVLNEQLGQLRTQLEAQGLRVSRLEVQTQLADSQTQAQWQGAEQHNRYQENRELALTAQRWRTLGRAETDLAQDVQSVPQRENISPHGLDIFA